MTIQEIEKIIEGHYHHSAKQENILKAWAVIEKEAYKIERHKHGKYIVISNKAYDYITSNISKTVLHLQIIGSSTRIISENEWNQIEASRVAAEKRRKAKEQKLAQRQNEPYGIYCIKYKDEVVYIGMTQTSFKERYNEHKKLFNNPKHSDMLLYHSGLKFEDLEFKVMVDLTKDKADRELTTRDIKAMEMGLIACFKPRFNVSGVRIPYRFS